MLKSKSSNLPPSCLVPRLAYTPPLSSAFIGVRRRNWFWQYIQTHSCEYYWTTTMTSQLIIQTCSQSHALKECQEALNVPLHPFPEASCWKKGNSSSSQTDILPSALLSQTPQHLLQDHVLPTPLDCTPQRTTLQTLFLSRIMCAPVGWVVEEGVAIAICHHLDLPVFCSPIPLHPPIIRQL